MRYFFVPITIFFLFGCSSVKTISNNNYNTFNVDVTSYGSPINDTKLISSHIKGWSECNDDERLDPDNGILLSPNIDSLFDKHFISFEDDGSILISDKVSKEDLEILGITKSIKLIVDEGMKKYLKHHRSRFNLKSSI